MIAVKGITLTPDNDTREQLLKAAARELSVKGADITELRITKRSIDARKKSRILILYSVLCSVRNERAVLQRYKGNSASAYAAPDIYVPHMIKLDTRPIVCGSGPAGMLAALILAEHGTRPIILERGDRVENRTKTVEHFFATGELDSRSNVQFGEGGAGTFSDGKLTTGVKDPRINKVIEEFLSAGAPEEIAYLSKPHVGTDMLRKLVRGIRDKIEGLGGEYRFLTELTDIELCGDALCSVTTVSDGVEERIPCSRLILAIGHSARDTMKMLYDKGLRIEQKPFSIGARIEHPQSLINRAQYGALEAHKALGSADYKLSVHLPSGRGVYTFCMCPGGRVVCASSEQEGIVTNGMSDFSRDGVNANSALLVGVEPSDFGSAHPLAGLELQRSIEHRAFMYSGDYRAPAQLVGDFLASRPSSQSRSVEPTILPGVAYGEISCCLPPFITDSMRAAIPLLAGKLAGFDLPDAVLTAPETRSSSPVRLVRTESLEASVGGIYPCGEGAGYAGGIMSAAVDGIKCAEALLGIKLF